MNQDREDRIVFLYQDGEPIASIAAECACSKNLVTRIARRRGLLMRGEEKHYWTPAETDFLIRTWTTAPITAAAAALKLNEFTQTEIFDSTAIWHKVRSLRTRGLLPQSAPRTKVEVQRVLSGPGAPSAPRIIKSALKELEPTREAAQPLRIVKGITQRTEQVA